MLSGLLDYQTAPWEMPLRAPLVAEATATNTQRACFRLSLAYILQNFCDTTIVLVEADPRKYPLVGIYSANIASPDTLYAVQIPHKGFSLPQDTGQLQPQFAHRP